MDDASTIQYFRPISICNTTYMIFSKIIVNRLKKVLSKMILVNQKGFVQGRHILDVFIYTHEVFHSIKLNKK